MSGPKVVRVVTADEALALREQALRQMANALAHWTAQARRLGTLDDAALEVTRARHARIAADAASGRIDTIGTQNQAKAEITFLEQDIAARESEAINRAATQRLRQRRLRENAAALRAALQTAAAPHAELQDTLAAIAAGHTVFDAEATLAKGFAMLSAEADAGQAHLSDDQRAIARALQQSGDTKRVAETLVDYVPTDADARRIADIEARIAELQTLESDADGFLARLQRIETIGDTAHRQLLLDSLVIDLSHATRTHRQWRTQRAGLDALAAEIAGAGISALALLERIAAVDTTTTVETIEALNAEAADTIADDLRRRAADSRRTAILDGLASLGYEVREGMSTTWADTGRVVLRRHASPGYGVEVGGHAGGGRLQVRAVALDARHTPDRDRDIETIWCGEFSQLQAQLAARGDALEIERALGIGTVPLKIVDTGLWSESTETRHRTR
ncbi:MAG: hypothetical protein ACTIJY_02520 [Luteimonas sp.]